MINNAEKGGASNANEIFGKPEVCIEPTVLLDAQTRFESEITLNEKPISWMADAIASAVESASYHQPVVKEVQIGSEAVTDIAEMFISATKVAIGARVFQVSDGKNCKFDKKNFEYPSLLGPVLGMYGVYHDATEAYDIYPVLGKETLDELKTLGALKKDGSFMIPEWYADVMSIMRKFHIMTNYGLPKEVAVESNMCFKVTVQDNAIIGKPGASDAEILISALVHSSKLTDLFGAYRTLYTGIETLRSTFESIGLKALHDLDRA
jgi:hypothetical protein